MGLCPLESGQLRAPSLQRPLAILGHRTRCLAVVWPAGRLYQPVRKEPGWADGVMVLRIPSRRIPDRRRGLSLPDVAYQLLDRFPVVGSTDTDLCRACFQRGLDVASIPRALSWVSFSRPCSPNRFHDWQSGMGQPAAAGWFPVAASGASSVSSPRLAGPRPNCTVAVLAVCPFTSVAATHSPSYFLIIF